jgi:hypothetical protein
MLPPIELDVPPHFVATEVEKLAERLEYLATATLGVFWHHVIAKIPAGVEWASSAPLKRFVARVKAAMPKQSLQEQLAEFNEQAKKAFPEQLPKFSFALLLETGRVVVDAFKGRRQFSRVAATAKVGTPNLMPAPKSIDPRDWALFLVNRILFYTYSVVAYVQTLKETNPYLIEETKKMRQTFVPAMENVRDELIEALKKMEKQTPPPWDPKEFERVRNHGMQEKMTTKEATLILGMTYVALLLFFCCRLNRAYAHWNGTATNVYWRGRLRSRRLRRHTVLLCVRTIPTRWAAITWR